MGCRPAKFSKVSVGITDSINDYQNGNITITQNQNIDEEPETDPKSENILSESAKTNRKQVESSNTELIISQMAAPRIAWKSNRSAFKSRPPMNLQRSQSQDEFFRLLEEKINQGPELEQKENIQNQQTVKSIDETNGRYS